MNSYECERILSFVASERVFFFFFFFFFYLLEKESGFVWDEKKH